MKHLPLLLICGAGLAFSPVAQANQSIFYLGEAYVDTDLEARDTGGPGPGAFSGAAQGASFAGNVDYNSIRLAAEAGGPADTPEDDVDSAKAHGRFTDFITINAPGMAGRGGTVVFEYRIDGSVSASRSIAAEVSGFADYEYSLSIYRTGTHFGGYRVYPDGRTSGVNVLNQPQQVSTLGQFSFGEKLEVIFDVHTYAAAGRPGAERAGVLTEASIRVLKVLDENGAELTNYSVISESGTSYRRAGEGLWAAGRDLARNEVLNQQEETAPTNFRVPQWSYGYRTAAGEFVLFTPEQHQNQIDSEQIQGFGVPGTGPVVAVNIGTTDIVRNFGSGDHKPLLPGQMLLNPASTGSSAVVRWTAPAAGRYNIVARWLDLDKHGGNGVSCNLLVNGSTAFSEPMANGGVLDLPFRALDLQAGDTVEFSVGSAGDNNFDSTGFNAAISLAPAIGIAVAGAEGGRATVDAGQTVAVTATVAFANPAESVELRDNGKVVGRADTAPYQFTIENIEPGMHLLQAVGYDARGVEGASEQVEVTVVQPAASAGMARRPAGGAADRQAASRGTTYFAATNSGNWSDPNSWTPRGVPGPNDDAFILRDENVGSAIYLQEKVEVANLIVGVGSKLAGAEGSPRFEVGVAATKTAFFTDCDLEGFELSIRPGAEMTTNEPPRFKNVAIFNNGNCTVMGGGKTVGDALTELRNNGSVKLQPPPASNRRTDLVVPAVEHSGRLLAIAERSRLVGGNLAVNGEMKLGGILSQNGVNAISENGGGLIGNDGGTLIGNDGGTLIGNDGGTLRGPDGSRLIGNDGGSVVSDAGAGIEKQAAAKGNAVRKAATSPQAIVLGPGAVVTGRGNLVGDVINQAGVIAPGSSADVIRIVGNYTQEEHGTLLIEIAGTTANPPQFDQLQVRGAATLGGKLIVKTIDNFTPQSGDAFAALTYNSVAGSFASVSSNAQVSFGPEGMTLQVGGPNPPAPKALNIATRMRVETGDNVLIAGFIITGDQPKRVLVRGIGPSLPVSGALADPTLDLDAGTFFNDDWKSDQEQEIRDTTIPPTSDLESAIVATLAPGLHTAVLRGKNDGTGVGLVEVYDLESGTPAQLANISTRGQVQTGDNVMIGGFIIGGDYPAKVLLRAIGPSLPVDGALQDPTLELVDGQGNTMTNDNWRATQEAEIIGTTVPPTNDREAAIVATLVPGNYTAVVRGKDDTIGVALVEGYNLQ